MARWSQGNFVSWVDTPINIRMKRSLRSGQNLSIGKCNPMDSWLEVSLTVNGELAEAVADVLARYAPNGVMTEQSVNFTNAEDEGTPVGPITVRAYLPADGKLDETRAKLE